MNCFAKLKSFFTINSTTIDNNVFRLHYKATAIILVAFSVLVGCKQYFGDPIDCLSKDDIPSNLLDNFCWVHATFSIAESWEKRVGVEIPYPGVDKYDYNETRVYHGYYQWVCYVLFLQAILFYLPRYFWKAMEGGRIKNLICGSPTLPEHTKVAKRNLVVEYMASNMYNHSCLYFMSFALAEIMNFANVVGQIFLMDAFLGGQFLNYGVKVIRFSGWDWPVQYDPMIRVFPRLTKCTFHRYGHSGDVQRHDAVCLLQMNITNEKIYLFLWFWFVILAVLSGLALLYRAVIVFYPKSRVIITKSRARLANQDHLETIINKCKLGDWLILDLLSKNLDPINFRDVIDDFAQRNLDNV